MKNDHTNTIFYCNWKTIKKYVSAKNQPKPICPSLQVATESVAEEKKKSRQGHRGRDAPTRQWVLSCQEAVFVLGLVFSLN